MTDWYTKQRKVLGSVESVLRAHHGVEVIQVRGWQHTRGVRWSSTTDAGDCIATVDSTPYFLIHRDSLGAVFKLAQAARSANNKHVWAITPVHTFVYFKFGPSFGGAKQNEVMEMFAAFKDLLWKMKTLDK